MLRTGHVGGKAPGSFNGSGGFFTLADAPRMTYAYTMNQESIKVGGLYILERKHGGKCLVEVRKWEPHTLLPYQVWRIGDLEPLGWCAAKSLSPVPPPTPDPRTPDDE